MDLLDGAELVDEDGGVFMDESIVSLEHADEIKLV